MITQVRSNCGAGMRWNEALGRCATTPPAAMSAAEWLQATDNAQVVRHQALGRERLGTPTFPAQC